MNVYLNETKTFDLDLSKDVIKSGFYKGFTETSGYELKKII
jgi:hypothetical protein